MKYPAIFFEDGEYIGVEFPDLPGCYSQGRNLEEAKDNASKALVDFLAAYEKIPQSTSLSDVKKATDTVATELIEAAADGADTHELMYNEGLNRLVTFPKNQAFLGEKLTAKIKLSAGAT